MQTIDFLRNFFIKGLKIHSSFNCIFLDFSKKLEVQNKKLNFILFFQNFDFSNFQNSNLKNHQIPNFKITEF
jgi:hypothetical protein